MAELMVSQTQSNTTEKVTAAPRGSLQVYQRQSNPTLEMARKVFLEVAAESGQVLDESQAAEQNANKAVVQATRENTAAQVDKSRATFERQQQVANVYRDITDVFSADAADSGSIVGQKIVRMRQLDEAMAKERLEIAELKGQSFFANPLGWIAAQMELPQRVERFNAAADIYNADERIVNDLTQKAANSANLKANEISTITAEQQAADAKIITTAGTITEQNAIKDAARSNSAYAQSRLNLSTQILNDQQQEDARQANERWKELSSINEKIRWDSDYATRELNRQLLREKIEANNMEEASVRAAAEKLGYTTPSEFAIFQNNYKRAPAETKNQILQVAVGQFGASPYESFNTIRQLGVLPKIAPNYQRMYNEVEQLERELMADTKYRASLPSNAKEAQAQLDRDISQRFIAKMATPGGSNINALGFELSPKSFLASMETAALPNALKLPANHPAIKAVQGFAKSDALPTTADVVQAISAQAAADGYGIGQAAQAISDYYKLNTVLNRHTQDLNGFGIGMQIGNNYNAQLQVPSTFGSKPVVVDLTNPSIIQMYLLKQLNAETFGKGGRLLAGQSPFPNIAPNSAVEPAPPAKVLGATRDR